MVLRTAYPLLIASRPRSPNADLIVTNKYTGQPATAVAMADAAILEEAITAAVRAAPAMRRMAPYERQDVLQQCVSTFHARAEELAEVLCIEAGKSIRDARGEVARLIETFRIAAEESVRISGEVLNLQISPRSRGYRGMYQRVPIGPCSLISPFNFPLNLVAHKIAPAIAAGCPFVLKPASRTPVSAILIGEILAETKLPEGAFSILPCSREVAEPLTTDERFRLLSFTGSAAVGWPLKSKAGRKKVTLELGGNAACIVDQDASVPDVVARLLIGAFYQSGQSCISVQRILIHESLYESVKTQLTAAAGALVAGDPRDERTTIGPMIDESEAIRLEQWVQAAVNAGGKLLCGGVRHGNLYEATLLEEVPEDQLICREEAFGPVAVLSRFTKFEDALKQVNDSSYGLQAGVFTRDLYKMQQAWDELEVGGVVIGDVPSWRVDSMPYGGVKDSGLGREGIRWAIEDMTELKLLVIRTPE
jgi:acyl-CoA reductase-like NAD-dependent aldehyde dehydrogenase